ncbi:MAG: hypothetical protein R2717_04380 [Schumannella sp.]
MAPGGGLFGGMGMPGEKGDELRPVGQAARRAPAPPEAARMVIVILLGVLSVVLAVLGPKILGEATNTVQAPSRPVSPPVTQQQEHAQLEASGDQEQADPRLT